MSADVEKAVAEVLKLASGRGEVVVALAEGGWLRLERWTCRYWSLRRDRPAAGQDIIIALWLHGVSELVADEEVVKYATSTAEYKIMREESEKLGIDGGPEVQHLALHFRPAELAVKKVYGNRVVYDIKPCRDEFEVSVARLYQPIWNICEYKQRWECQLRQKLTENVKARGLDIEDVVDGVYVPLDVSALTHFLRRVL